MKTETIIQAIILFLMFIILLFIILLALNQMEQKFIKDCEKQNFQGIKEYWEFDINCSEIEFWKNMEYVNKTRMIK